jgi:hypothetical protein
MLKLSSSSNYFAWVRMKYKILIVALTAFFAFMSNSNESHAAGPDKDEYIENYLRHLGTSFGGAFHPGKRPSTMHAKVSCLIRVNERRAAEIKLVQSSGDASFDDAAMKASSSRIRPSMFEISVVTEFCCAGVKAEQAK